MKTFELVKLAKKEISLKVLAERSGVEIKNNKAICIFHDDHSPSMHFDFSKKRFKCFVCGAGGDVVDFYNNLYKTRNGGFVSKKRAAILLLNEFGIPIDSDIKGYALENTMRKLDNIRKPVQIEHKKKKVHFENIEEKLNYLLSLQIAETKNEFRGLSLQDDELSIQDILNL